MMLSNLRHVAVCALALLELLVVNSTTLIAATLVRNSSKCSMRYAS